MSDCLFCRIIKKELPADVVYEDPSVVAFKDIHPQAPVHLLVVPKKHIPRLMEIGAEDAGVLADIHKAIQTLAQKHAVDQTGFRIAVNNGPNAGQAVDHLHYHVIGGRKLGWPPG
jgi:histidine triad (HIT) family protein